MSEAPEKIITDEEIAYVHANANFGSMSPRDVVSDGVRKYAVGYTGGSTQVAILREHGLITATKGCGYKANLTEKGKRYARAIYSRADLPPTPEQIKADPRVQALVVAQDRIDSLSAQLAECEAQLLKVTAEREEENIKFQMANTAWDQETATRKVAEAQAATEPVLFKDMTDAEQGALLLAKHRGEAIQRFGDMGDWLRCNPTFNPDSAYRVAPPKPKIEHVREKAWFRTQKVTVCFTTIDGVVDIASYRLEPRND